MHICMEDLTDKILLDFPNDYHFFNKLFEFLSDINIEIIKNCDKDQNRKDINSKIYDFLENCGLTEESKEHFIFDNIRHAFINFKNGGLLELYQYREAEVWYPKIVIDSFIGIKEDIDKLDKTITVYRGTSKEEYESENFGQSWSRDKEEAKKFAFKYYKSQPNYKNTLRVILSIEILKESIFYYKEEGREEEVIVNPNFLMKDKISILEEKILNEDSY